MAHEFDLERMNTNLLLSWLNLPPGAWPPDDRTLLGIGNAPIDPFTAEKKVMELMERLRPHQLVHPELVTEGMNRLAQALVSVSMGGDEPPSPRVPPPPPPPSRITRAPTVAVFEPLDLAPTPAPNAPPSRGTEVMPAFVEAEIVEAEVVEAEVVSAPSAPTTKPPPRRRRAPAPLPPISFALPEPGDFVPPSSRRKAYRELAGLRQLRRAWRRLRPSVADPSELLHGPAEVCGFLEAVLEVRAALSHRELSEKQLGSPGRTVRLLIRQPFSLAVFRTLVVSQRRAIAGDWAAGWAAIESRSGAVRRYLRDTREHRRRNRAVVKIAKWFGSNPEWLLGVLTMLGLIGAGVRTLAR